LIQLSKEQSFASVYRSATTSDTVGTLNGTSEGETYYWRVQANNVAGSGPWSEVSAVTVILAPTDLKLEISAVNEITLSWRDNSDVEDGYIIERKQGQQTSFAVLDTLEGSGNEYVDRELEINQTYTYRVKAYKDSGVSDYSNEAALILTSVKEEAELPTEYSISQNYPNPFWSGATSRSAGNPTTTITFAVPRRSNVLIKIFDVVGNEVMTVVDKEFEPGIFKQNFNAEGLTSGIYFYRMESDGFSQTRKLMFLR
jgi:fibronectin type 3 domain-containing protein